MVGPLLVFTTRAICFFLPEYEYNGILCGHCKIAVGVHWVEFVSHVKFRQMNPQR